MATPAELVAPDPSARTTAELPPRSLRALARDQVAWSAWYTCAVAWLDLSGLAASRPALAVGLALGIALSGLRPRLLMMLPAFVAATVAAALAAEGLGLSPILAAGAMAGVLGAWLRLESDERSALDLINGGLATAAAAGIGAWLAELAGVHGLLAAGLVGVVSAQGLAPTALRWRSIAELPSPRKVQLTLSEAYRPPVLRALELFRQFRAHKPERDTLQGLEEVASWVYRLALSIQTLDRELTAIDRKDLEDRIELMLMEAEETEDAFTRERRIATAAHLSQMLQHTEQIQLERQRTHSLQEYAVAYLEEARMGLLLARQLPGESTPMRLDDVLKKLRTHAQEGDARRQTAREIRSLEH